jgi:1-acyl-sn-glycerol-3-phosphate acyltransferase
MLSMLISKLVLRLFGWRIEGSLCELDKCVFIVAPHTSNWDFVFAILVKWSLRVQVNFLGKASLFRPPFGWWFRWMGGAPVDRSHPQGLVDQVVEKFQTRRRFRLSLAPEGTRKKAQHWKSGFYQIASGAGVPLQLVALDLRGKRFVFGQTITLSGEVAKDMDVIRSFYAGLGVMGEANTPVRLQSEVKSDGV